MSEENMKTKKPFNAKLFYRRTCLIIYDIISVILASYVALLMRYNFEMVEIPDYFINPINRFLPINIAITLVVLYLFRMYNSLCVLQYSRRWESSFLRCRGSRQCREVIISCIPSF